MGAVIHHGASAQLARPLWWITLRSSTLRYRADNNRAAAATA